MLGIDSCDEVLALAALAALVAAGESGVWGWEGRWEVGRTAATRPGTGSITLALSPLGDTALYLDGCTAVALW